MDEPSPGQVTAILRQIADGDQGALAELFGALHDKLHAIARMYFQNELPGHILQTTALLDEACLKLLDQKDPRWNNRAHFLATAAMIMRRILVNHAVAQKAQKRGGGRRRIPIGDVELAAGTSAPDDLIAVDEALTKLAALDGQQAQIVELIYFAGLTITQVAKVLEKSPRTIDNEWSLARAWLRREIEGHERG